MATDPFPSASGSMPGSIPGVSADNVRIFHVDALDPIEPRDSDVRLTLPARPENVSVVRHVLGAFAEALDLPEAVVEDIRLAITEACTNVVRHAYGSGDAGPGPLEIVIRPDGDRLEVIVSDHGRGIGPSPDTTGPGLGLPLIAAIVQSLEIHHAPSAGSRLAMSFSCGSARLGAA